VPESRRRLHFPCEARASGLVRIGTEHLERDGLAAVSGLREVDDSLRAATEHVADRVGAERRPDVDRGRLRHVGAS
jgi:hypothetical protein